MPRVSVIAATYNHAKYIHVALTSLIEQTFQDWDFFLTDDGSSDRTVDVAQTMEHPRFQIFHSERRRGGASAFTNSLSHATGDYIALWTTDDVFDSTRLEKQVRFLDEHPDIPVVMTQARLIGEDGEDYPDPKQHYYQSNRSRHEWLNHFFQSGNNLCSPSAMFRREFLEEYGYFRKYYSQIDDYDMWVRACLKYDIHVIQEPLTRFRMRAGALNASGRRPDTQARLPWEVSRMLRQYLAIPTVEELLKIFPQLQERYATMRQKLIPFYVAILALERNKPAHNAFAINTLYDLMEQEHLVRLLEETHNLSYPDLFALTAKADPLNILKASKWDLLYNSKEWKNLSTGLRPFRAAFPKSKIMRLLRE